MSDETATRLVLDEVMDERIRQDLKWGEQNHPDGTGPHAFHIHITGVADRYRQECESAAAVGECTFRHILMEEVWEAAAEADPAKLRAELLQVSAVAAAWIEAIDRRAAAAVTA